jgi:RNAse (barnase) inhibitor barstar
MRYDQLFQSLPSGVYAAPPLVGPLRAAAKRAGIGWYDFDLKGVVERQGLLRRFSEVFALPAHFGNNWDALHECLREPADSGVPGAIVHWRRGPELARRAPEVLATALEILQDAARYWRSTGRTFIVAMDRDSARGLALRPLRWAR